MRVYVLTAKLEDNNWHPVGVVTAEDVADQWERSSPDHDRVPFDLDDLSLTGMAADAAKPFKPVPLNDPEHPLTKEVQQTTQNVEQTNKRLKELMEKQPKKFPRKP